MIETEVMNYKWLQMKLPRGRGVWPRCPWRQPATKRRGDNLKGFQNFGLNAKARIWPWQSQMCHIRLTADCFNVEGGSTSRAWSLASLSVALARIASAETRNLKSFQLS